MIKTTEEEFRDKMRVRRDAMRKRIQREEAALRFEKNCKKVILVAGFAIGLIIVISISFLLT